LYVVPTPLNFTDDTPVPAVNPLPVTETSVPGGPLGGVNDVTVVAATAGITETVSVIVIAASDTTDPRTNARVRILMVTSSRLDV
jgi:hypothetical protein